jgi:superfamily I DNA and RNA helicase
MEADEFFGSESPSELEDIDKMIDKFYDNVFDLTYDMYTNADLFKPEIKAILGKKLRDAIDQAFKDNFD